jgi:hypothetical protein
MAKGNLAPSLVAQGLRRAAAMARMLLKRCYANLGGGQVMYSDISYSLALAYCGLLLQTVAACLCNSASCLGNFCYIEAIVS